MDKYPEEKPFAPTAGESFLAVFVGLFLIVAIGIGFMIKVTCYYQAGKTLSGDGP